MRKRNWRIRSSFLTEYTEKYKNPKFLRGLRGLLRVLRERDFLLTEYYRYKQKPVFGRPGPVLV